MEIVASAPAKGGYDASLFERIAAAEDRSFWFRARNRLIVQIVRDLPLSGDRVLEVGCGTGYVLRALAHECGLPLAHECGLQVTGSELFQEGLEQARLRVPDAERVQLDAREMPYEEEFDLAGAFDVIEHVEDDVGVLRGMHRALRPGGYLMLTVPQHRWLWSAADDHAHHVRRYRRWELVDRVRAVGFEPVRATSFVTSLLPLMAISRWRQRISKKPYDPIDELVPAEPANRILERVLTVECALIRRGADLPVGGSLALVARRPVS